MRSKIVASLTLAIALCLSTWGVSVAADESGNAKPGVVEARAASVTGTVVAIDYNTRSVTLKGPDGNTMSMEVGPEVVRFNEVKKGDQVKIDYLESVAVVVQSPHDTVSSAEASGTAIIRNKTKKPSGTAVQTQVITATVVKINAKKRTAELKMPNGDIIPIDIAPDVTNLENVKKGDQIVVKYTQTLAVSVTKP